MSTPRMTIVAILVFALLALCLVKTTDGTCYVTGGPAQPDPWCSPPDYPRCLPSFGYSASPLPSGETYMSFYSWILDVLGTDNVSVQKRYIDTATTNPNIFFAPNQTGCYVNLTFVYEVASFRSKMGIFTFPKNNVPTTVSDIPDSSLKLLFNETSVDCKLTQSGDSCLSPGSTHLLGPYTSADAVGFFLDRNLICKDNPQTFYSIDALNTKQTTKRLLAVLRDPNTRRVYVSWEDAPDGTNKLDYNDNMYSITSNCTLDYTKIPCANVTSCRNRNQTLDTEQCTCICANQASTTCLTTTRHYYNTDTCSCACRKPTSCPSPQFWNATSCQCECPVRGTCTAPNFKWNATLAGCGCKCPPTALEATGAECPNSFYKWNPDGSCTCVCPTSEPAGAQCAAKGLGNLKWNSKTCGCTCPTSGTCKVANQKWNASNSADVCGCQCPATPELAGTSCPGNRKWNSSRETCACYCPAEAPADSPCTGNFVWNSTLSECDCYCPLTPPDGKCPGVQVWNRDFCQCMCPTDDPCFKKSTQCKQFQCSEQTGQCQLVYEDVCATQKLQFNTTGCLAWLCDDSLGCVRQATNSCCTNYTDCASCALVDGCDWLNGAYCDVSGQVLTSPLDKPDHPNCNPSTGLSAGQTAGITVGIVAGVSVGVGGAAALLAAGYIAYRLLNRPPIPDQLPTIENLDAETGTGDNPLFHGNQVEMTNPMFAGSGGAAPVPSDLHTL